MLAAACLFAGCQAFRFAARYNEMENINAMVEIKTRPDSLKAFQHEVLNQFVAQNPTYETFKEHPKESLACLEVNDGEGFVPLQRGSGAQMVELVRIFRKVKNCFPAPPLKKGQEVSFRPGVDGPEGTFEIVDVRSRYVKIEGHTKWYAREM